MKPIEVLDLPSGVSHFPRSYVVSLLGYEDDSTIRYWYPELDGLRDFLEVQEWDYKRGESCFSRQAIKVLWVFAHLVKLHRNKLKAIEFFPTTLRQYYEREQRYQESRGFSEGEAVPIYEQPATTEPRKVELVR